MLENLVLGLQQVIIPYNLLMILAGVSLGIVIGVLPGLQAASGLAILLPITFFMDPIPAFLMMVSLYLAAEYGGSITAIALGIPGTPPAIPTVWDGFPLSQKGLARKALGVSIIASSMGGIIGAIILIVAVVPLAAFALRFGPAEYFALGVFGLSLVTNLAGKSVTKATISVIIGLLIVVVGVDVFTGYPRFTFGEPQLLGGIPLVPALIGLFAVSKVFQHLEERTVTRKYIEMGGGSQFPSLKEFKRLIVSIIRGSGIGALIGIIPGAGATIASLIAYGEEKRASKHPEQFGTGVLEGISAPESANNAAVGGALVPLIALGIPGSASTAIMIGGLMLQGLRPGPLLMVEQPVLVYSILVGLLFAAFFQFIIGSMGIRLWVNVISTRVSILVPFILGLCIIGAYGLGNSMFDVVLALIFGVLGYLMEKFGFPLAPMVLAIVLGFIVETNLRRALAISGGSYAIFFTHPISIVLIIIAIVSFVIPLIRRRRWQA